MIIVRRQKPPLYLDYTRYKPFLRIDFRYQCAYCRVQEATWGTQRNFAVEHFKPKSLFKELLNVYSNLNYACNRCNDYKGSTWPSDELRAAGFYFCDPCSEDLYRLHAKLENDGSLSPLTNCGKYTIEHVNLNRRVLKTCRQKRLLLMANLSKTMRRIRQIRRRFDQSSSPSAALISELVERMETAVKEIRSVLKPAVPPED